MLRIGKGSESETPDFHVTVSNIIKEIDDPDSNLNRSFNEENITRESPNKAITTRESPNKAIITRESPNKEITTRESPNKEITARESPNEAITTRESPNKGITTRESPNKAITTRESPNKEITTRDSYFMKIANQFKDPYIDKPGCRHNSTKKCFMCFIRSDMKIPKPLYLEAKSMNFECRCRKKTRR